MIRRPTSLVQAYDWHRRALRGEDVDMFDGLPEAGWYKMQRVKGGPYVPVEIRIVSEIDPQTLELTEPERFIAIAEGETFNPAGVWTYLRPISKAEHDALVERHRTDLDMAATRIALDLTKTPTLPPRS